MKGIGALIAESVGPTLQARRVPTGGHEFAPLGQSAAVSRAPIRTSSRAGEAQRTGRRDVLIMVATAIGSPNEATTWRGRGVDGG